MANEVIKSLAQGYVENAGAPAPSMTPGARAPMPMRAPAPGMGVGMRARAPMPPPRVGATVPGAIPPGAMKPIDPAIKDVLATFGQTLVDLDERIKAIEEIVGSAISETTTPGGGMEEEIPPTTPMPEGEEIV